MAGKAGRLATISMLEKVLKTAGKAVKNPEVPEVSGPTHGF